MVQHTLSHTAPHTGDITPPPPPHPPTLHHPLLQAFTAFGPTLIQPTWFLSRELVDKLGPFSEQGRVSYMYISYNYVA